MTFSWTFSSKLNRHDNKVYKNRCRFVTLGRETRTKTHPCSFSTRLKFIRSSWTWRRTTVQTCSPRFINVSRESAHRETTVRNGVRRCEIRRLSPLFVDETILRKKERRVTYIGLTFFYTGFLRGFRTIFLCL